MQTGFPLQVTQTNNNSVIGTSVQFPNATGTSPQTSGSLESRLNDYHQHRRFQPGARLHLRQPQPHASESRPRPGIHERLAVQDRHDQGKIPRAVSRGGI